MKAEVERLFKRFDREEIKRDVEEELRFHLELLTQEHLLQDMSFEEAKDAALKRFGNVRQIENQCLDISSRSHPGVILLKSFFVLVFLGGVLLRIFSRELHFSHIADILIAVGALGRLLVYVRGLNPSSFLSNHDPSSPLMLNDDAHSIRAYDQRMLTPVERVIADK